MKKFLSIFLIFALSGCADIAEAKAKKKAGSKKAASSKKAVNSNKEPLPDEVDSSNAKGAAATRVPENVLHEFQRSISFDPHPLTIQPMDKPLVVKGAKVDYQIEFIEKWKTDGKNPSLKEIGFNIIVSQNGNPVSINVPSIEVKKSMEKGEYLGGAKFGDVSVQLFLDDLQRTGKDIVSLTVAGKLTSPLSAAGTSETSEVSAADAGNVEGADEKTSASGITLAKKFMDKADGLVNNKAAQIALLTRALSALGENPAGEALKLADIIRAKLSLLNSEPAGKMPSEAKVGNETKSIVAKKTDVTSEKDSPAKPIFEEAKKNFAIDNQVEGRNLLRQAVEKDPKFWPAWKMLGENALSNSKYTKAKEAFESALQHKSDDLDSAVGYFKACYYGGESEIGLEKLRQVSRTITASPRGKIELAKAYFQAGDFVACEEECLDIISKFNSPKEASDLLVKTRQKTR
ncbi:MAG: hypothetical protein HQM10_07030 [Candidatus Riflebacteria bacterium]|nr:hypothetical protein [Candidatus Riflebacteria bacterium]